MTTTDEWAARLAEVGEVLAAEEERDEIAHRMSCLLDRLTYGLFSKPGYSVDQMKGMVDEAYQKIYAEDEDSAQNKLLASETRIRDLEAALAAEVEAHGETKARVREWLAGLGWLGGPQDERVEAEGLAILDGTKADRT